MIREFKYIISSGELQFGQNSVKVEFGIIKESNGNVICDFYIGEDTQSLQSHIRLPKIKDGYCSFHGFTTTHEQIEVFYLTFTKIRNDNPLRIRFYSYGHLMLKRNDVDVKTGIGENEIFNIEVEGLDMKFHSATETKMKRNGRQDPTGVKVQKDYNEYLLQWKSNNAPVAQTIKLIFEDKNVKNTTLIKIAYISKPYFKLTENAYQEIKKDLIEFLSFYNGGYVVVRRENLGKWQSFTSNGNEKILNKTEIHNYFSYSKFPILELNNYLHVRNNFNSHYSIIHPYFNCFNNYRVASEKYGLGEIINILNGINDAGSVEQKFYTLIITLERLAYNICQIHEQSETYILPDNEYAPLKLDLFTVFDKHKESFQENNIKAYHDLRNKINGLNKIRKGETLNKFLKMLEVVGIERTQEIYHIIDKVRNSSVHKGNIGAADSEKYKNYWVLDKLIRDIILNLIEYDGPRKEKWW
jgi:hypothetical protein